MNFSDLQDVILYLKAFVACPSCKRKLQSKNIHVLATIPDGGLLLIQCDCQNTSVLNFIISRHKHTKQKEFIDVKIKNNIRVNANDVMDIHNRLKDFKGDLRELL